MFYVKPNILAPHIWLPNAFLKRANVEREGNPVALKAGYLQGHQIQVITIQPFYMIQK